jgi:putative spermidine/putrescine transport system substrate-binding protein
VLLAADVPVSRRVPSEGATAWADSWLLAKQARHPNCAYLWLRHVLGAEVQASQALLLRESPVNPLACPIMDVTEEGSCAAYYGSAPAALLRKLEFWRTPVASCAFRAGCVPYKKWQQAWANVVR